MALEFHKITNQIEEMARYLLEQDEEIESKVDIALKILAAFADEAYLPYIHERVQDAVEKDAGYRGARPTDEPIMNSYPPAPLPESATLIATDGSQIYPRRHDAARYYLLNIGSIIFHHGSGSAPEIASQPTLFFNKEYVHPEGQDLVGAITINARRTVAEMEALAGQSFKYRGQTRPLIALLDGPLLFVMGNEVSERDQLRRLYFDAMGDIYEVKAALAGYIDKPNSTFLTRLLHLLDIPAAEVRRSTLAHSGRLDGIIDAQIFQQHLEEYNRWLLPPGHRSAIFVQMSPQNKEFRQRGGEELEIAFFYMNVAAPGEHPHIARVEVPVWVAGNKELVAELQALLYDQCQKITTRYPYVLMRADELAVIRSDEQQQLNTLIKVSMSRLGLETAESAKQTSKNVARAKKTRFEM